MTTVLAVAATVLALAACDSDSGSPQQAGNASVAGKSPATLTTLAGNAMRVPGSKPTALFFFSVGCGECAEGAKSFAKAAAAVADQAQFLAVSPILTIPLMPSPGSCAVSAAPICPPH